MMKSDQFSFCESVFASSKPWWHIRALTAKGRKTGGGADTLSLCGRAVSWDLDVEITDHHLKMNTCTACSAEYSSRQAN